MIAIVNSQAPKKAIEKLSEFADVVEFNTHGITYEAISGHVDVFMCQISDKTIVAAPNNYINYLSEKNIEIKKGDFKTGDAYPKTAHYNAVVTHNLLIHNLDICDPVIINECKNKHHINVKQAYTRCNLLPLGNDVFITSDKGIEKTLLSNNLKAHYVNPHGILLPGFMNGFIGGCMGIIEKRVFIVGELKSYADGYLLKELFNDYDFEIIELYEGPLFDVGSIFFINEH